MGNVYVMGIDPGVTTGWAVIGAPYDSIFSDAPSSIEHHEQGEVRGPETAQVKTICKIANRYLPLGRLYIVCEDFDIRRLNRTKAYTSPISIRSKLEMALDLGLTGAGGLELQMPGLAMQVAPDQRLKAWGLYKPGEDHHKDATRHAITFIRRAKADRSLRERAWGLGYANMGAK
jgi:hypothetical protein